MQLVEEKTGVLDNSLFGTRWIAGSGEDRHTHAELSFGHSNSLSSDLGDAYQNDNAVPLDLGYGREDWYVERRQLGS